MTNFPRTPLLISLAFAAAVGCARETDVERANREGIMLVGNAAEPRALDLQLVTGVPENKIISSLFEGLIADHPYDDDQMEPGVATHWEHNEDMTKWVFHLRPDAKWSDGEPLNAEDFIFSYHRMLNPGLAAAYAPMLHAIKNAEAYNRNERGHILCGLDENFPVPWDVLKKANFSGNKEISLETGIAEKEFNSLSRENQIALLAHTGLDRLKSIQFKAIKNDPELFDWPEEIPPEARLLVIERLHGHVEAGSPDLFQQAQLGLHAPNPHTLEITLREPVPYLPSMTRHSTWFPVPKHVILQFGEMTDRFTDWSMKTNLVGNGPFKIKDWRYNNYIEVERNPHYWDADKVSLNGIRYHPIENPYTEARAFLAGQLHTTYSLPAELYQRVKKNHPEFLRAEPYVGTVFLRLNVTRKGLDNPLVREALSLAINRAELCNYIYEGFTPATTLTPEMGNYKASDVLHHDLEKAKQLLAEAGYPNGNGLPSFSLLTSRPHPAAEVIQNTFRNIGVRLTIEQKDWGSYIASQQNLNFDMALAGWIGDYLDPTTFLDMWTKNNGNNNTGWDSPEYEALLRQAAQQANPANRYSILADAETLLMNEKPILPIAWYSRLYLHHPSVKGWHPLLLDNHPWKTITLVP